MTQHGIPVEVTAHQIKLKKSLGGAIELCAEAAGFEGKQIQEKLKVDGKPLDKAQWSRWTSGEEGVKWPRLSALMDFCGNDAPLLWMLHARGYDLASLRRCETQTERELRLAREEIAMLRHDKRVLTEAVRGALLWEEPAPSAQGAR